MNVKGKHPITRCAPQRALLVLAIALMAVPLLPGPAAGATTSAPSSGSVEAVALPESPLAPPDPELPATASAAWWVGVRARTGEVITGLSPTPSWAATGDNSGDAFGYKVASAGDVNGDGYADVIVGAQGYSNQHGAAYVFHGSPAGLAATPALTLTGENDGDVFGCSVAGAGDVNGDGYTDVIVGAVGYDPAGAAYVYHGSPSGLSATPARTLTGENDGDVFGCSVASAGDVNGDGYADVIVGANRHPSGSGPGAVYVYHGSPSGLAATPALTLNGEADGDRFGGSVASAGDVNGDGYADIIVGAHGCGSNQGRAYVYHGSASGLEVPPARTLTGANNGDYFGHSVAGAGDVNGDGYADVVIGAERYTGGTEQGRAYIYRGSATGLAGGFSFFGQNALDLFGHSVAGAGDVNGDGYADVLIGADGYSSGSNQGAAYLYYGAPTSGLMSTVTLTGEGNGDRFGSSAASAGDVNGDGYADVVVGAPGYSSQGRAYAYHGAGSGLTANSSPTLTGENEGDRLGYSVASAGDVNGDGYADVIIGADGYDPDGAAFVYHGSPSGLTADPARTLYGEEDGYGFGWSVASAGDVNGDGYADVIVGMPSYPSPGYRGRAYVYHGSPSGVAAWPAYALTGENNNDEFGHSVASAGDVNGDGYADVIVGAYGYGVDRGRAYVYHGSPSGLGATPALTLTGEAPNTWFGRSVAGAGDVNGDGYADVIVGATGNNEAYVYHGSASGLGATPARTLTGEYAGDGFGGSVAAAGDVNGDGCTDVIVGAVGFDPAGAVYVYHGSPAGLAVTPARTLTGENDGDRFACSVAGAGDVNGDGYADVVVGAAEYPSGDVRGRAYIYHGSPIGLGATPALTLTGENDGDRFGCSVASAGDVNGDGYADAIVGASGYPEDNEYGRAYVYQGNDGGGRTVLARQLHGDGSGTPVQPWGLSLAEGRFEVQMQATDPMGRGRVKLQVEACPPGAAFGDPACTVHTSTAWTDVTASADGVTLNEIVSGLHGETLYRWRARVLYAPLHVTETGITPPPKPAHGPWRRFLGQAVEADLRTLPLWEIFLPFVCNSPP